jgi:hypothetical protein
MLTLKDTRTSKLTWSFLSFRVSKAGLFLAGKWLPADPIGKQATICQLKWLLADPIGKVKEEKTLNAANKHYDTKFHLQFGI